MLKLHRDDPEGPPCRHMEHFLQKTADGSANFFERWYAKSHANGCGRCNRFLDRLIETLGQLKKAKQEPDSNVMERLAKGSWRSPE